MAFRLRLSQYSRPILGYVTYRGDVFFSAVNIAEYLQESHLQGNRVLANASSRLGAISHNCPLHMRNWLMIEMFHLLHLLDRMHWGDVLLGFFRYGKVKIFNRGRIPLIVQHTTTGVSFRFWLRHFIDRVVRQRPAGLRI